MPLIARPTQSPWEFVVDPRRGRFSAKSPAPLPGDENYDPDVAGQGYVDRYGKQSPEKLAEIIMGDIGLQNYDAAFTPQAKLGSDSGVWSQDARELSLDKAYAKQTPAWMPETVHHEIGHLADHIVNPSFTSAKEPYFDAPPGGPWHHANYSNRADIVRDVIEQNRVERGEPADPNLQAEHPWLKKVVPLSSNRLANPWTEKLGTAMAVTPDVWNFQTHVASPQFFPKDMEPDPNMTSEKGGLILIDGKPVFYRTKRPGIFDQVHNAHDRYTNGKIPEPEGGLP